MFRMLQISDPHLSAARGYGVANFDAAVVAANASRPDLVVASGDLVLDDPDDRADQDFARSRFDRLTTRWRALPGNHDIGDTPPDPWMGDVVTDDRRGRGPMRTAACGARASPAGLLRRRRCR
jgi:3',5'-cyclic AMP phosphodiesterase CpdA